MLSCHPTALAKDASGKLFASRYSREWEMPGSSLMADHARTTGREQLNTADPHVVAKLIREYVWSPIVWHGGLRKSDAFAAAIWCSVTFDCSTFTAQACKAEVESAGLAHVIAYTRDTCILRNGGPPHESYVLLLRSRTVITFPDVYGAVLKNAQSVWPSAIITDALDAFYLPVWSVLSASEGFPFSPEIEVEE